MNLATFTTSTGMDSREIAERTGKNHADVCRDIRRMLQDLGGDESKFASVYQGGNNEARRCFVLPKRECLILATGYRVDIRAKIIDRWAELEAGAVPRTFAEALQLAADQARQIEDQARQIAKAAPAVAFVERYVEADGSYPIRVAAKMLGMQERKFIAYLVEKGILFRMSGRLTPVAHHMEKGRFQVKAGEAHGHAFAQPRFTPAGFEWISKRVRAEVSA